MLLHTTRGLIRCVPGFPVAGLLVEAVTLEPDDFRDLTALRQFLEHSVAVRLVRPGAPAGGPSTAPFQRPPFDPFYATFRPVSQPGFPAPFPTRFSPPKIATEKSCTHPKGIKKRNSFCAHPKAIFAPMRPPQRYKLLGFDSDISDDVRQKFIPAEWAHCFAPGCARHFYPSTPFGVAPLIPKQSRFFGVGRGRGNTVKGIYSAGVGAVGAAVLRPPRPFQFHAQFPPPFSARFLTLFPAPVSAQISTPNSPPDSTLSLAVQFDSPASFMPGGFQKGNKIGNRFKRGTSGNPMGRTLGAGVPRTIRAKWMSVESGLKNAGLVLDIVNQELESAEVQASIRNSIRNLACSNDPVITLRFLTFVMTFAPKTKQEALVAEFAGNRDALRRAVAKLDTTTGSGSGEHGTTNNLEDSAKSPQDVDIGLDA